MDTQGEPKAFITAAEPQLFVADIDAAIAYYVGKLGFEVAFSYGEPRFYAQVVRGGGRLNLRKVDGPVFDSGFQMREQNPLAATMTLTDAEPLFSEFQLARVYFQQPIRTEPWGARTFVVQNPDGNSIAFAGA